MSVETSTHLAETNRLKSPGPLTPELRSAAWSVLPTEVMEAYKTGGIVRDPRHMTLAWGLRQDAIARDDITFIPVPELAQTVTQVLVSFGVINPPRQER